jgi:hypothetical protein
MILLRRTSLAEAKKRQVQRQAYLDRAAVKLAAEVAAVLGEECNRVLEAPK